MDLATREIRPFQVPSSTIRIRSIIMAVCSSSGIHIVLLFFSGALDAQEEERGARLDHHR